MGDSKTNCHRILEEYIKNCEQKQKNKENNAELNNSNIDSGKNNIEELTSPEEIYKYTKYLFHDKKQEYFYALYFNNKQQLLNTKLLFIGTINQSITHPREVFKEAYLLSASSIICLHNHPSNDTTPSKADITFTKALIEIGKIQNIPILDHIIVGDDNYYSFYEHKNILNL